MPDNKDLNAAAKAKKDEFYTQYQDIEVEMKYHVNEFKGKIVFCNCDDPEYSNFWRYFHRNFAKLKLKKLISTHYQQVGSTYKMEYEGGDDENVDIGRRTPLQGNGDFRSQECIELLKEADIISSNPPFSLFKIYLPLLEKYGKKIIVLGNMNAITCKEISPLFQEGKIWYGPSIHSGDRKFYVPDDYPLEAAGCGIDEDGRRFIKVKGVRWFTNFDYAERHNPYECTEIFSQEKYPQYDNFEAINVSKSSDIPIDYSGLMGVPVSFIDKWCPEQFEIVGFSSNLAKKIILENGKHGSGRFYLNGERLYDRIVIKYTEKWKRNHSNDFGIEEVDDDKRFAINNRRYTGSKYKLMPWIREKIEATCQKHNSLFDVFGGTGVVTAELLDVFESITINDFLFSNEVIYKAFFGTEKYDRKKLEDIANIYNSVNGTDLADNYVSLNYGDKYFQYNDAKVIGYIRQDIEDRKNSGSINEREASILIASLLYSFDRCANTVGHYEAYIQKKDIRASFVFELIKPIKSKTKINIERKDANVLARAVRADVAFIDPPYNSRQYSRFYHVMETITKWDKPILKGVAMKPPEENMSEYCRSKAPEAFRDLIQSLNVKYIVVTYNNTYDSKSTSSQNKITLEQIQEILEKKGNTQIFDKGYHRFNAGKTDESDHREYLFITSVEEEQ